MLSKVARAFSASQERFTALKREGIISEEREREKLALAPEMKHRLASPRVTFLHVVPLESLIVVAEQLPELAVIQVEPVKSFVQMQEQMLEVRMLVPPSAQGVACWHLSGLGLSV